MKLLRRFTREQWTFVAGIGLSGLFVLSLLGGGAARGGRSLAPAERTYSGPPSSAVEFIQDKFSIYWEGRDIFSAAVVDKLQVPELRPPVPRLPVLVGAPLRPAPTFEVLNRSSWPVKYVTLGAAASSVAAADVSESELQAALALEEPADVPFVDRRAERMGKEDVIHRPSGPPLVGRIVAETKEGVQFRNADGSISGLIKWSEIAIDRRTGEYWIERSWTVQQEYEYRTGRIKPGQATLRVALANWCREQGMVAEARTERLAAIETLRSRNDFKQEMLDAVTTAGAWMIEWGDFEGAIALYTSVTEWTDNWDAEMWTVMGHAWRKLGLLESALESYSRAVEMSPRMVVARIGRARVSLELGRDAEVLSAIGELFSRYAESAKPAERVEALAIKGVALLRQGDLRGAADALQEAIKGDGRCAEALNAMGVLQVVQGQIKEGVSLFVGALRANQYVTEAWTNLAGVALAAGRGAQAEALYGAALQRDPTSAHALAGVGVARAVAGREAEALAKLDEALAVDPNFFYAQYVRAHLKLVAGAHEEALKGFVAALQQEFFFVPAYAGAAMAYVASASQGMNREMAVRLRTQAETLLCTVRDFEPGRAATYVALGCVLVAQGRGADAEKAFAKAMELSPGQDPLLTYGRGFITYWHGAGDVKARLAEAREIFLQGQQTSSTDPVDKEWAVACADAARLISEWQETSVFYEDQFERPETKVVGGRWMPRDKEFGIRADLDGQGHGRLSGKQTVKDMGLTSIECLTPRQDFLSFEVTLMPQPGRYECGITLYHTKQSETEWMGLHVGRDVNGKLQYAMMTSSQFAASRLEHPTLRVDLPDPREIRLRLERKALERGGMAFDVFVWNPAKGEWSLPFKQLLAMAGGGVGQEYKVAVWTRALKGQEVTVLIDNAKVLLRRSER